MSIDGELFKSWSRLTATDLQIVRFICSQIEPIRLAPELCGYLGAMAQNEIDHRDSLRVTPEHIGPWRSADNGKLSKAYSTAYGIKRAAIQSNTLAEWASLLLDSVCDEMANRLTASQMLIEQEGN